MRMKSFAFAVVLALATIGLAVAPAYAEEKPTVQVDVAAANGDYGSYQIDDGRIVIGAADSASTVYELSGSTSKVVFIDNPGTRENETFYLRLGNATLSGGIAASHAETFCLNLEVPEETTNYVRDLHPFAMNIYGGGMLNAGRLDVGPNSSDASAKNSFFTVEDTQIRVEPGAVAQKSCQWMGDTTLSKNASVTVVSDGDYAPLRVSGSVKGGVALTLEDDARLYCLHVDADKRSSTYVDGLQVQRGSLLVRGSSYLEAEARPLDGLAGEGGCAVYCANAVEIKDSARVAAHAAGWALVSGDKLLVSGEGAHLEARSSESYGIYLEGEMRVDSGARVDVSAYRAAALVASGVTVDGATLLAESATEETFVSENPSDVSVLIRDSTVEVSAAAGCGIFPSYMEAKIERSLVNAPAGNAVDGDISDSIVFVGDQGTVFGDATVTDQLDVAAGETLTIPAGSSLTVAAGGVLVNNGTIVVLGTLNGAEGTIVCNSHGGGSATCATRAVCNVCGAEYGELDPSNHAHGLQYVQATPATAAAEGNAAYWHCPDCGKYFADEAGAEEVSKESVVVPKLASEIGAVAEKSAGAEKPSASGVSAKQIPATGDAGFAFAAAAILLAGFALAGAGIAYRRR